MEDILWYLLPVPGGTSRARILRALEDRPKNANQISEELDLDYTTIRHHLDVLMENNVVKKIGMGTGTSTSTPNRSNTTEKRCRKSSRQSIHRNHEFGRILESH